MGGAQFAGSAVEVGGATLTCAECAQVAEQRHGLVVGGRFALGDEVVDGAPGGRLVSGQVVQARVAGLGDRPYSGLPAAPRARSRGALTVRWRWAASRSWATPRRTPGLPSLGRRDCRKRARSPGPSWGAVPRDAWSSRVSFSGAGSPAMKAASLSGAATDSVA